MSNYKSIELNGKTYLRNLSKIIKKPDIDNAKIYDGSNPNRPPFEFIMNKLKIWSESDLFEIDYQFYGKNDNDYLLFGKVYITNIKFLNYKNKILEFILNPPTIVDDEKEIYRMSNNGYNNLIYYQFNSIEIFNPKNMIFRLEFSESGSKKLENFIVKYTKAL
jgi:hypothetical protein